MRFRLVGTLVTLAAACLSSGCFHHHHCLRHPFRDHPSCGCVEADIYPAAPSCGCGCGASLTPPLAPNLPMPNAQSMGGAVYSLPPR